MNFFLRDEYLKRLSHFKPETKKEYKAVINYFGIFTDYNPNFVKKDILEYIII